MSKMKLVMGIVFLFLLIGSFSSCTSADDNFSALEEEKETIFTAKSSKQYFANNLNAVLGEVTRTRSNDTYNLDKHQLALLQNSAIKMLKDEGVYSSKMDKLIEKNNAGVVFVGLIYLSLEKTNNFSNAHLTRSNKNDTNDEGECFSFEKLQNCIYTCGLSIIGAKAIEAILKGYISGAGWVGCMTRLVVKELLEKVAGAMIGFGVSLTLEMTACVWGCMEINL